MTSEDTSRLQWLKNNPTKTYNDLPQGLWDEARIAAEVGMQEETLRNGPQLRSGNVSEWPFPPVFPLI